MIRQAQPDDEPAIRACAAAAYAPYILRIGRAPAPMLADFAAQIAAGQVHVATGAEGVAGYVVFCRDGEHVLLESVAVLPQAAGQGIGKALIGYCEAAARAQRARAIHLYTNEKMTENLSIYPRLGYVEAGRRVKDGFARVYFEKVLQGTTARSGGQSPTVLLTPATIPRRM